VLALVLALAQEPGPPALVLGAELRAEIVAADALVRTDRLASFSDFHAKRSGSTSAIRTPSR
jgi:hypothetical protein